METSSNQFPSNGKTGGMWNNAKVTYSKETQEMLKVMMEESKLTNIQRKKINGCLKEGLSLPQTCNPTSSKPPPSHPKIKSNKPGSNSASAIPKKRTAANCRAGDSYKREEFRPVPTRDLEKEKKRLQHIMELGQEPKLKPCHNVPDPEVEEKDRFQEVLEEIEERRQFLSQMTALGQGKHYQNFINIEISQRIRELEILDKVRSAELQAMMTSETMVGTENKREKTEVLEAQVDC